MDLHNPGCDSGYYRPDSRFYFREKCQKAKERAGRGSYGAPGRKPGDDFRRNLRKNHRDRRRDRKCGGGKGNRDQGFPICDPVYS